MKETVLPSARPLVVAARVPAIALASALALAASALVTVTALAAATAAPAAAQSPAKRLCLGAAPRSSCQAYLLFEFRGSGQVWNTERIVRTEGTAVPGDPGLDPFSVGAPRSELGHGLAWDLGYAFNVTDHWAVGATLSTDLIDGRRRDAALHLRRWLTDDLTLELAPGVFRLDDEDGSGFSLGARFILWDLVLEARYDALDVPASVTVHDRLGTGGEGTVTITDPGGWEHGLSVGGGLQHVSGLVASIVLFALAGSLAGN